MYFNAKDCLKSFPKGCYQLADNLLNHDLPPGLELKKLIFVSRATVTRDFEICERHRKLAEKLYGELIVVHENAAREDWPAYLRYARDKLDRLREVQKDEWEAYYEDEFEHEYDGFETYVVHEVKAEEVPSASAEEGPSVLPEKGSSEPPEEVAPSQAQNLPGEPQEKAAPSQPRDLLGGSLDVLVDVQMSPLKPSENEPGHTALELLALP